MLVVDWKNSEQGSQRRKTADGRLLHCCCICGRLEPWNAAWSTFCSMKEMDDGDPIPKFCGADCAAKAGRNAENVTADMKRAARDAEWREPELAYREATDREKYAATASEQVRRAALRRPSPTPSEKQALVNPSDGAEP